MNKLTIALASAGALALAACGETAEETAPAVDDAAMADQMANGDTAAGGTIVEVAQDNGDYSTLVSAVTFAGLGETMAQALTQAIEGAGEGGYTLTTVNGATLTATAEGGNVVLTDAAGNSATVTATDIDASNGVIHVIDTVLMPG